MVKLLRKYFLFNLSAGMEYRASFLTQVFGMFLNNSAFIFFWIILFKRIGSDINGYGFTQVMFLWALTALGYGVGEVFMGNARYISSIIYKGELDVYLLQPKPLIPNLVCSKMNTAGWGDIAYGIILYALTQEADPFKILLFIFFSILMAIVFIAISIIYHSLTFFLGNAEQFAGTATEMIIMFVLYPGSIFSGPSTWILHSLIPAALIAWIPAELFESFEIKKFLILLGADLLIILLSILVFNSGLKKYSSGNKMGVRI